MPPVSVLRPNTSPLRNEKHNIGAGMCLRYRGLIQPILNLLVRRFAGHITALNLDHHASREPGREAHVTSVAVSGEGEAVGVREPTGPSRTSNGGFGCSADIAWTSRHKEVSFSSRAGSQASNKRRVLRSRLCLCRLLGRSSIRVR